MNPHETARELRSLDLPDLRQRQLTMEAAHAPTDAARALLVSRARHEARKAVQASAEAFNALQTARAEWAARNPHAVRSGCPDDHAHGLTATCHQKHGCRCDLCMSAQRVRMDARKRRQRDSTLRPVRVTQGVPAKPDLPRPEYRPEVIGANRNPGTKAKNVRESAEQITVSDIKHGIQGYNKHKCRCLECRQAKATSRTPKGLRAPKGTIPACGTLNGYWKKKCRCDECRKVASEYTKARYAAKKAQKEENSK